MNTSQSSRISAGTMQTAVNLLWPYIMGKRGLVILTFTVMAAGLALNWGWLVAVGVAPILIGVLPCVVMCALGLCCMNKGGGKSCSSNQNDQEDQ